MAVDKWRKEYDVVASQASPDTVSDDICDCLGTKGFCVVDIGIDSDTCANALVDIHEMDNMGKFTTPAALVADGLFGQEGSSRIAEMDSPGDLSTDGEHLQKLDMLLTEYSTSVSNMQWDAMGEDCRTRTLGLVHETDTALDEVPDLVEKEASTWLNTFVRAKVVIVICLGPGKGTLELRPFDDHEAEAVEVETSPGMMILLRSDILSHSHSAHGKVNLLSCHVLAPKQLDKRSCRSASRKMTPMARAIDNWCLDRLQVLKSAQEYGQQPKDIPPDFMKALNQVAYKGQRVAVRSCGSKLASTYNDKKWYAGLAGGPDFVVEVSEMKWQHKDIYDPEPEMWRMGKTFAKHASFCDGIELFDNKLFGLSPAEATSMDPHQTCILECGYEALFKDGYKKKTLMNTVGGVYVGSTQTDWSHVPKDGLSAAAATGSSASITSNRMSFCLGLKGPSMTIDSDGASGLMVVHMGCEGVVDKGRGVKNVYSVAGGIHFNLAPAWWPQYQAAGLLSKQGRCFTFDESAEGVAKGDGCCLFCVRPLTEVVDGQTVQIEETRPYLGVIASSFMNNNGMNAGMGSSSASAEQELICTTLRNSNITSADIDGLESHGDGSYLGDAIEAGAFMRALRCEEDTWDDPLLVGAVKSNVGDCAWSSGSQALLRVLLSQKTGLITPNCHLNALNPHMEFGDLCAIGTEHLEHRLNVSYHSVTAKGFGGTNVHAVCWGRKDEAENLAPDEYRKVFNRNAITYWPGGGGVLDDDLLPRKKDGYFIAGTWNRWVPEQMEMESENSFGFTVVLGENRWEKFQIWLDGNDRRKLHPPGPNSSKGREVMGPVEDAWGLKWAIDGRSWAADGQEPDMPALTKPPDDEAGSQALAVPERPGDIGRPRPGDQYRVHLRVAGKYRTVEWERIPRQDGAPPQKVPEGTYSVISSWNGWTPSEMFRDDSDPDSHYLEVKMPLFGEAGGYFALVRNEDMEQVIYPDRFEADAEAKVLGPDELGQDLCWFIRADLGDTYRIDFNRRTEFGLDRKQVSWRKVE